MDEWQYEAPYIPPRFGTMPRWEVWVDLPSGATKHYVVRAPTKKEAADGCMQHAVHGLNVDVGAVVVRVRRLKRTVQ